MDPPALSEIRQAQQYEEPSQTLVLRYLYQVVYRHLGFLSGFCPELDDLVQDSMLQIYRALPRFRHKSSLKTWALKISTRTAKRHLGRNYKRAAMEVHQLPDLESPGDEQSRLELLQLAQFLNQIPDKQRQAFVLMDIMGQTAKEAAKAMGTFSNTASSRLRLARTALESLYHQEEQ